MQRGSRCAPSCNSMTFTYAFLGVTWFGFCLQAMKSDSTDNAVIADDLANPRPPQTRRHDHADRSGAASPRALRALDKYSKATVPMPQIQAAATIRARVGLIIPQCVLVGPSWPGCNARGRAAATVCHSSVAPQPPRLGINTSMVIAARMARSASRHALVVMRLRVMCLSCAVKVSAAASHAP